MDTVLPVPVPVPVGTLACSIQRGDGVLPYDGVCHPKMGAPSQRDHAAHTLTNCIHEEMACLSSS